jgi:Ca2+-binding EF-hand superfamily protein
VPGEEPCADVTGDGKVTFKDLLRIAKQIGKRHQNLDYDVNGDGHVDITDLLIAVSQLGESCDREPATHGGPPPWVPGPPPWL